VIVHEKSPGKLRSAQPPRRFSETRRREIEQRRGSFDVSSNRQRILLVGPAPARLFLSVSLNNSSTETPNARAIGGAAKRLEA
jgi:hypothetical protein